MFRFALRVKAILNSASLVHRLQDHVTPFRPNNHFYLVSNDLNMTWIIIRKNSLMISETAANIVSWILYEYPYSIQRWADPLILCNDFAHYAGTRRRQSLVRSDLLWQDGHAQYEHRTKHTESSAHRRTHIRVSWGADSLRLIWEASQALHGWHFSLLPEAAAWWETISDVQQRPVGDFKIPPQHPYNAAGFLKSAI